VQDKRNLDGVLAQVLAARSEVIPAGMMAPAGMGNDFSRSTRFINASPRLCGLMT